MAKRRATTSAPEARDRLRYQATTGLSTYVLRRARHSGGRRAGDRTSISSGSAGRPCFLCGTLRTDARAQEFAVEWIWRPSVSAEDGRERGFWWLGKADVQLATSTVLRRQLAAGPGKRPPGCYLAACAVTRCLCASRSSCLNTSTPARE